MNTELWKKIASFDFDTPFSEYGFSTRLAKENFWTKAFTEKALLEYKKFMYLAVTSDMMVSPSEVVDLVWHQHLIFTQSYSDFCKLIGKNIRHIPSTHNREDADKFRQAKERTTKLYKNAFGEQPKEIWDYADMYEPLELPKAKINVRTFILIGILAFITLLFPCYFVVKPLYIQIDNPSFLLGYGSLIILVLIGLELYNRACLVKVVKEFKAFTFVYSLHPFELVYLKTQDLAHVVHGNVNRLFEESKITVNKDKTLALRRKCQANSIESYSTIEALGQLGSVPYEKLSMRLTQKPIFRNVANCMDAFKKYFIKSKRFGQLFYLNFGVLAFVLLLGALRFLTGLLRDRPLTQILIVCLILTAVTAAFLWRLSSLLCTRTLPQFYKNNILPARPDANSWEWQYFLLGTSALTASFMPLVHDTSADSGTSSGCGSGGSSDSSCGSSCSSCGGCGGD